MLRFPKIAWLVFIVVIILSKIYLRIAGIMPLGGISAVLLLFFLIFFVVYKTKTTWFSALMIFLYGLYELFFISVRAAQPTKMQFTYPLINLLYGNHTNSFFMGILNSVPLIFYSAAVIFLLTPLVRRQYQVI
jgi:hypothetical protein